VPDDRDSPGPGLPPRHVVSREPVGRPARSLGEGREEQDERTQRTREVRAWSHGSVPVEMDGIGRASGRTGPPRPSVRARPRPQHVPPVVAPIRKSYRVAAFAKVSGAGADPGTG